MSASNFFVTCKAGNLKGSFHVQKQNRGCEICIYIHPLTYRYSPEQAAGRDLCGFQSLSRARPERITHILSVKHVPQRLSMYSIAFSGSSNTRGLCPLMKIFRSAGYSIPNLILRSWSAFLQREKASRFLCVSLE